jgi:signal transduction histidine kinase
MNSENRVPAVVNAIRRAAYRLAGLIAGLSFWQFALLGLILLAAAAIIEDLWVDPSGPVVRAVDKRAASTADSSDARVREKASSATEIRIGKDSVIIHRRANPGQGADAPDAEGAAGKSSDSAAQMSDAADPDTLWTPRKPPLVMIALLLLLALIVMRMFARAQQRAEKRTEAARAIAEREVLQRQVVEARLQLLQAQVEPHFLFNSLAAVEHLIETAPVRAAKMQRHLIDYLRAAVPRMRQQSATLGQEVELCVSYLEIMRMRMEERLQFKVAIPGGLGSARFPPMMLQSLIENSVRHGLEPKSEGGSIDLTAEVRDGKLCVTVADTGLGFSKNARAGVGLANIRERLQQLFGSNGSLTIEPNHPCGTRATITLPYAVP